MLGPLGEEFQTRKAGELIIIRGWRPSAREHQPDRREWRPNAGEPERGATRALRPKARLERPTSSKSPWRMGALAQDAPLLFLFAIASQWSINELADVHGKCSARFFPHLRVQ
jgi:hypothetical protein